MDKIKTFLKSRAMTILLLVAAIGYYIKQQKAPNLEEAVKDVMLLLVRVGALAETATAVVGKLKGATPTPTPLPSEPPPVPTPDNKENA